MNCKIKEVYKKYFSKVKIYDLTLWKSYGAAVGVMSSIVGLVSFFVPNEKVCMSIGGRVAIFIILLVGMFIYLWWCANQLNRVCLSINNTKVEVVIGDIFGQLMNPDKHNGEITVIAVNNHYDYVVDDRIVSNKSLHGQYINKIIEAGKIEELNEKIEKDQVLQRTGNPKEHSTRKEGRKIRYELGSLVEFENHILTAFTNFDDNNKAFLSADEYLHFWMKFWENIDSVYAGRTINIPLMGAGITRFRNGKPTKQQLLEMMLWTLKISGFHNTYGDKKIKFIIYEPDATEINFYSIQHNIQ